MVIVPTVDRGDTFNPFKLQSFYPEIWGWVNFWTKSSDKLNCNLVSMITRLVSLAFAIIALILLLRKQFHALDIFF